LVTCVVVEDTGNEVLGLALGSSLANVAARAVFVHGTNHVGSLGVDHLGVVGRHVCRRGLVGDLELTSLVVQVEDVHFLVASCVGVVGSVGRLQVGVVLVLQHFVLDAYAVLA